MNHLLSIGRFAQLCETTADTLVYYEKLGLLRPSVVTSTGRRLYDIGQYHTFHMIRSLSECGIPLSDIRSALISDSQDSFMQFIKETEAGLRRQLRHLEQTYNYLEQIRPNLLLSQQKCGTPFILVQGMSMTLFATFFDYFPITPANISTSVIKHKKQCHLSNIYPYPIGLILQKKSLYGQNNRRLLLYSPHPNGIVTNKTPFKNAGEYAVILHKGSLDFINDSLTKLYDFIETQHFIIASDTYINFYHDSLPGTPESFYLIKVRFIRR